MRSTFSSVSLLLLLACGRSEPPFVPTTEAQELLAEAGYPGGKGFPKLVLIYNTVEHHKKIAVNVQESWRAKLGIQVELQNMEWKDFLERQKRGDFDVTRAGFLGEYLDPHAFLALLEKGSTMNRTGWGSDAYDNLLAESNREPDPAKRFELLGRAERILLDEAPVAPIFHYYSHNWIKPFVQGVWHNPRDMHPLQGVTLEGPDRPKDGALIYCGGDETPHLDPGRSHDVGGLKILMHLFEGLTNYDPRTSEPVPAAAERWEISDDGKTWTFHLRPAQWSNGDPLTAQDFVHAWRRVVDPKTASAYADRMDVVRNARAIIKGQQPPDTLGVRAADERTLVVELEHRAPWFIWLTALNIFYPVHRATVERHGDKWTRPENMVNNGPYRMAAWIINDRKEFEKNPRYRAAADMKLEKFVTRHPGGSTAVWWTMYEAGQVHWVFGAPTELIPELKKRPDYKGGVYNGVYWYGFNTRRKPLDDARVRRALAMSIDKKVICEKILQGGEQPADRFTPALYETYKVP